MAASSLSTNILIMLMLLLIFHRQEYAGGGAMAATFTLVNKCSQTIWPAILGSPVLETTGFELHKGASRAIHAPTGWSGRFWARTGCEFDGSGRGSCTTGDCGSDEMECRGSGAAVATLVEFTLGSGSMDFYDVSLVDGYNLPVAVDASGGSGQCASTGCAEDLNRMCPPELRTDGGGACRSACDAFNTAEYCCKGEYASPAACRPSSYAQLFKSACPKSYSYAFDDATSTFTCTAGDYVITFCPSSSRSPKPSKPDNSSGSGSVSGSGGLEAALLADASLLADLATGGAGAVTVQVFPPLLIVFVHLALGGVQVQPRLFLF